MRVREWEGGVVMKLVMTGRIMGISIYFSHVHRAFDALLYIQEGKGHIYSALKKGECQGSV